MERRADAKQLLAETGFYSAKNAEACEACSIEPFIAVKRDEHHLATQERFTEPAALPADATPAQTMAHKLKTKVLFAKPVGFSILKSRRLTGADHGREIIPWVAVPAWRVVGWAT